MSSESVHEVEWAVTSIPREAEVPNEVISLERRRDARERARRRRLVEGATVREYEGRAWERDHEPRAEMGWLAGNTEWRPRA